MRRIPSLILLVVVLGCGEDDESIPPGAELRFAPETGPLILGSEIQPVARVPGFWLFGNQVSRDDGESWEPLGLDGVSRVEALNDDAVILERPAGLGLLAVAAGTFFDWPMPDGVELGRWTAAPGAGVFFSDAEARNVYVRGGDAWEVWAPIEWRPDQLSNRVRAFLIHDSALVVAWNDRAVRFPLDGSAPVDLPLPPSSTPADEWYSVGGELFAFTNRVVARFDGDRWTALDGFFDHDGVLPCPDGSFLDSRSADWRPSVDAEWQTIEWLQASRSGDPVHCDELGSLFGTGTGTFLSRAPGADRWVADVPFPLGFGGRDYGVPLPVGDGWLVPSFRVGYRWDGEGWLPNAPGPFLTLPDGMIYAGSDRIESTDGVTWRETEREVPGSLVARLGDGSWVAQQLEVISGETVTTVIATIHRSSDEGASWQMIHESERVCSPAACRGDLHAFEVVTTGGELVGDEFSSVDGVRWSPHGRWALNEDWPSYPTVAGLTSEDDLVVLAAPGGPIGAEFDAHVYRDAGRGALRGKVRILLDESSEVSRFRVDGDDHLIGWQGERIRRVVRSSGPIL